MDCTLKGGKSSKPLPVHHRNRTARRGKVGLGLPDGMGWGGAGVGLGCVRWDGWTGMEWGGGAAAP